MPLYFLGFLATLAATVLLYLAAVAFVAIRRRPAPAFIKGGLAHRLQGASVALLWAGVGMCWLLYFNVYRIHVDMNVLGEQALHAFNRAYTAHLPIVVLPYGLTCLVSVLGLWSEPVRLSQPVLWAAATLCIISIVTTPFAAGALGDMHDHGFSDSAYQQLQVAHFARSLALTAAALWVLIAGWTRPALNPHTA